jgi:hypothetical protein
MPVGARLLRLDVRGLDDRPPLLDLGLVVGGERFSAAVSILTSVRLRNVMLRESGASSNPGLIARADAAPQSESGSYWIARFRGQ